MFWHNIDRENKVGLYATLAFHLVVLIILLSVSIGKIASRENTFVLDFTKQEELEKELREQELKEQINKELDNIVATASEIRNVAVDAGYQLKDDRFKNPSEVYDQARELQRKLDESKREALSEQAAEEAVELNPPKEEKPAEETKAYSGPSVISWSLEGRKARVLPVPAYKGYGAGDVYVKIKVNRSGRVVAATVIKESSTSDKSLHEFAIEAARRSRFSGSDAAPDPQTGEIVYRFIAQ